MKEVAVLITVTGHYHRLLSWHQLEAFTDRTTVGGPRKATVHWTTCDSS